MPTGVLAQRQSARSGLDALLGGHQAEPHPEFVINASDEAENASQVQIAIQRPLPGVESVALVLSENPFPVAAIFQVGSNWAGSVTTRITLAASGRVTAIARASDRTWCSDKTIKVIAGGCA